MHNSGKKFTPATHKCINAIDFLQNTCYNISVNDFWYTESESKQVTLCKTTIQRE